jgi:hypothetical protein
VLVLALLAAGALVGLLAGLGSALLLGVNKNDLDAGDFLEAGMP